MPLNIRMFTPIRQTEADRKIRQRPRQVRSRRNRKRNLSNNHAMPTHPLIHSGSKARKPRNPILKAEPQTQKAVLVERSDW